MVGFDLQKVQEDELALLSRFGDTEAKQVLWANSIPQVTRVTRTFIGKFPWISHEDLVHDVLAEFPTILRRYNPSRGTPWNKYLYFAVLRMSQDVLRREDPLGIGIPRKATYPEWFRLEDLSSDQSTLELIVEQGTRNLDEQRRTSLA